MAENIARGIHQADPEINVKLFNSAKADKNDIIAEIFKSKAVAVGSPTINKGILTSVAGILEEIRGLGFKGKKAAAFGCYGWSGESVSILSESLQKAGFTVVNEGLKVLWNPTEESKQQCIEYGKALVDSFA
jgi:flavorubredoxin